MYDRLVKNLAYLKKENLLKSKDYGLGKENLWSIKRHPLNKEQGYSPAPDIHTFKYEHEKACGDVFVSLALTGKLYSWQAHKRIGRVIPDRIAEMEDMIYIEVEMGSQNKIKSKATLYQQLYRETREPFQVLFVVQTDKQLQNARKELEGFTSHYRVEMLSDMTGNVSEQSVTESTTNSMT